MGPSENIPSDSPILSTPTPVPQATTSTPTLPWWKRVLAFIGYIVVYYLVSETIVTLLVVGITSGVYFYIASSFNELSPTFPAWISATERIGAAIIGILAAWIVGRYFHWTVFRKIPREKKPHAMFTRIAFYGASALIVLLFILMLLPSVLGLFFKDRAPIDDSDLSLPTISLPDAQNAYPNLIAAGNAIDRSYNTQQSQDIAAGKTWDAQPAAQAVASNTSALALLASAAQKPSFQDPAAADPSTVSLDTPFTPISPWRILIQFNCLAALSSAYSGNSNQGIQTAMMGVDMAQKIENSQDFLISWLAAVSMKTQSLQTLQNIIASTTVRTQDLKSLAANLSTYTDDASGLAKAEKISYYEEKSTIESIAHGDMSDMGATGQALSVSSRIDRTSFYYHPNESISLLADETRQKIADAQSPCDALIKSEPAKTLPSNLWLLYVTPNAIGKVLHDITAVSLDSAKVKACQENVQLDATRLMAAIKAYQQDNKKLPATLDDLVPTYLADMPLDPFNGQEFKYDPARKTISSVGQGTPAFSVAF